MSTPSSITSQQVARFRDCFVVEVGSTEKYAIQLGSGVLLCPRVVATCRHVVEHESTNTIPETIRDRVWVRRRDADPISAKPLFMAREGAFDDVALLVLDEPLGGQDEPYPTLLAQMTEDMANEVCGLMVGGTRVLRSGAFYNGEPKTIAMEIGAPTIGSGDVAIWYQLTQGQTQLSSGGPLWIASPSSESTSGVGLVIGLMAVDANPNRSKHWVPGVLGSGAVTSDSVIGLRDRLGQDTNTSPEERVLLDGIAVTLASEALASLRKHGIERDLEREEPAHESDDQGLPPTPCRVEILDGSPIPSSGLLLMEPKCEYTASHRWQVTLHVAFRQPRIPPDDKMRAYIAFAAIGAWFKAEAEHSAIDECPEVPSLRNRITPSSPGAKDAVWTCFPRGHEGRDPGYLEGSEMLRLVYQAGEGASLSTSGYMMDTVFVDASGNPIRGVLKCWALLIRLWRLGKRLKRPTPGQIEAHHRIVLIPHEGQTDPLE